MTWTAEEDKKRPGVWVVYNRNGLPAAECGSREIAEWIAVNWPIRLAGILANS